MSNEELAKEFFEMLQDVGQKRTQKRLFKTMMGSRLLLNYLKDNIDSKITPGDISKHLNLSTARVSTALNNLEDKGLIVRNLDEDDKRRFVVLITELGIKELNDHNNMVVNAIHSIFEQIGNEDANSVVRILNKISELNLIENLNEENE